MKYPHTVVIIIKFKKNRIINILLKFVRIDVCIKFYIKKF